MSGSALRTSLQPLSPTARVALVAARWHSAIVERLIEGAKTELQKAGVNEKQIDLFWVDGSYEIPQAVEALARTKKYAALVPLGCIVRGETAHFELIAQTVFRSLDEIGRVTGVAVSCGILTADTVEQAMERAGGKYGNKGEDAVHAALALAHLIIEARRG